MSFIAPTYLKPGEKVALVAPARKVVSTEMTPAIEMLKAWGLEVVLGNNLYKESNQFSGTEEERLSDFQSALDNPEIKAIFCARGGYGTTRIIERINFSHFFKHPKWIVGFSDITSLHGRLLNLGFQSIHSAMPILFEEGTTHEGLHSIHKILFGEELKYKLSPSPLNREGSATGLICGGNLSLVCNGLSTSSEIETGGRILFLEEVDEYIYHIDRMMVQLSRSGKLKEIKGLILGSFTKIKDNEIPFGRTAIECVLEAVKDTEIPIAVNFPAGHQEDNRALIIGRTARFEVNSNEVILEF